MKNILYTFLVFALFFSCNEKENDLTDNIENDLTEANLKGNIESVYTTFYFAIEKFGELTKVHHPKRGELKYKLDEESIYNDNGNLVEENRYIEGGLLNNKYKYKYDDNGNKIEQSRYYYENRHYDKNGNKITKQKVDSLIIEKNLEYNKEGELTYKYKFKYDDNGNLIEQNSYVYYFNANDVRIEQLDVKKINFKYDDNGNQIEHNSYCGFDSFGVDYDVYYSDFFCRKFKFNYNDNGNQIEQYVFYESGELEESKSFKYDDNGNMIELKGENPNTDNLKYKSSYEYKFDDKENWIQKTIFKESNQSLYYPRYNTSYIIEREIEYYD